jgi:predicted MFS family arabinose efflux permease
VLVTGTLWWVVFTFLTPLGSTLGIMMLLRILVGVGQGLLVPANFSLAARWVPKSESGKATGLLQVGLSCGDRLCHGAGGLDYSNLGLEIRFTSSLCRG